MFKKIIIIFMLCNIAFSASAICIRNPSMYEPMPEEWKPFEFDSESGIKKNWNQYVNENGQVGLPTSINILSDEIQPIGSMIHTGGAIPPETYGRIFQPFESEQVLYICSPDEEGKLYEGYIVNTDSYYHRFKVIDSQVPEGVYTSYVKRLGWRAKNVDTGKFVTDKWQLKPLNNLDRDKFGRILIKTKNFSNYEMEIFKIPNPVSTNGGSYNAPNSGNFGKFDPFVFIFFISHSNEANTYYIPNCKEGSTLGSCSNVNPPHVFAVLANRYPGGSSNVTTVKGCAIVQVTPSVVFDKISTSELNNGDSRMGKIEVEYACNDGAEFGTGTNSNAIGFKVPAFSATLAENFGFKDSAGTGVRKLVAENYSDPTSAKGVAIEIFPKDDPIALNWLTSNAIGGGHANGWYKPIGILQNSVEDSVHYYKVEYDVKLSKMNQTEDVRPGRVSANAEVLIIVQ